MSRSLIAGLLIAPVLVAAPVPKDETDAGRMQRIYGSVHDPDKVAEFKLSGDSLQIIVPKEEPHSTTPRACGARSRVISRRPSGWRSPSGPTFRTHA